MRRKTHFFGLCVLSVLLAGCAAQTWHKAGATDADFRTMKATCEAQALKQYPVMLKKKQIGDERMTPLATRCTGAGATLKCSTTGGQYVPPKYITVDDNEQARDQAVQGCFIKKGWEPD